MITINLGSFSIDHMPLPYAYGILRSTFLPLDAIFLAVQGLALGIIFGNPKFYAAQGALMAFTDRIFLPLIENTLPGNCNNIMGVPLGLKNITLAVASFITSCFMLKKLI